MTWVRGSEKCKVKPYVKKKRAIIKSNKTNNYGYRLRVPDFLDELPVFKTISVSSHNKKHAKSTPI